MNPDTAALIEGLTHEQRADLLKSLRQTDRRNTAAMAFSVGPLLTLYLSQLGMQSEAEQVQTIINSIRA